MYNEISNKQEASFCEALHKVIQEITGEDDEATLEILALHRLGALDQASSLLDALLDTEETCDLFERDDVNALRGEKKGAARQQDSLHTFAKEYKEAKQKQQSKTKGRQHNQKGKVSQSFPTALPFSILQGEANRYIPPTSSIWRGLTRNSWHGHYPGRKRISSQWIVHGESGAMRDIIRWLWVQHCEKEGLELEEVPIRNLWDSSSSSNG